MDYANTWNVYGWMHPVLTALATNPAYYWYYHAKTDLFNQSVMVRRGHQRVSKRTHSNAERSSSVRSYSSHRGGNDHIDLLKQHGIEACPQCHTAFVSPTCRPVQESCGHIKCRSCFISNDDGCPQCKETENPCASGNPGPSSVRAHSNRNEEDLMPPLLTVEEPILNTSSSSGTNLGSYDRIPSAEKELPPLLSSVKSPFKRKQHQSVGFSAVSEDVPTAKLQKINSSTYKSKSLTVPDNNKGFGRPRSSRRSSFNSTSSSSSSSIAATSTASGLKIKSNRSSKSTMGESSTILGSGKRNSLGCRSSRKDERKKNSTVIIENNVNISASISSTRLISQHKNKLPVRVNSLRSSTGSSSSSSIVNNIHGSKRKIQASFFRKETTTTTTKDSKTPFAITISPALKSPTKGLMKPLVSPSKASTTTTSSRENNKNDMSVAHSSKSISSISQSTRRMSSSSSGEDSNSSFETTDTMFLKGDSSNSTNTNERKSKPETKKKKKRSPVTIHDHITVLSGDPLLYQCNVCMKKFKTKAHIKYHEFCQNGEKPFKCGECGQGFIAKSHYEYHLRTHTGERPYKCPQCHKGFNQRGKVTRHLRSHTGEKPFICQQCSRGFANAQALRSHFLIHTGERPFACQYCNKRFTGMTNLKKHVITHTGERPFSCAHCGKSFGLKWTLDLHLRTHSTERPFACDQCSRAFSNSKDLRRHLVIHSGERPFKCWICGTAFRRKDNLDRHIKNTHNQPKEIAKQLANEAAAEYMAMSKNQHYPKPSRSHDSSGGSTSKSSTAGSKRAGIKKPKQVTNSDISEPSSPSSPNTVGSEFRDTYVLPNGQNGILGNPLECNGDGAEAESDSNSEETKGGFAELRTVPESEWHKIEALKMLEMAKNNAGDSSNDNFGVQSQTQQPAIEPNLIDNTFSSSNPTSKENYISSGLTVTVLYEDDGRNIVGSHYISEGSDSRTVLPIVAQTSGISNEKNAQLGNINESIVVVLESNSNKSLSSEDIQTVKAINNKDFTCADLSVYNTNKQTEDGNDKERYKEVNCNNKGRMNWPNEDFSTLHARESSEFKTQNSSVEDLRQNQSILNISTCRENEISASDATTNKDSTNVPNCLSPFGSKIIATSDGHFINQHDGEFNSDKNKSSLINEDASTANQKNIGESIMPNNKRGSVEINISANSTENLLLSNNRDLKDPSQYNPTSGENYLPISEATGNVFQQCESSLRSIAINRHVFSQNCFPTSHEQNSIPVEDIRKVDKHHELSTVKYPDSAKRKRTEKTTNDRSNSSIIGNHYIGESLQIDNSNYSHKSIPAVLHEQSYQRISKSQGYHNEMGANKIVSNNGISRISTIGNQQQLEKLIPICSADTNESESTRKIQNSNFPLNHTSKSNSVSLISTRIIENSADVGSTFSTTPNSLDFRTPTSQYITTNSKSSPHQPFKYFTSNTYLASSSNAQTSSHQDLSTENHQNNTMNHSSSDNNFRFVYNPEVSSPPSQPSFRFIYSNGEPAADDVELLESNMRIVYARASATAEPVDSESNAPQKVRLVFAEAVGIGTTPDTSGQVHVVYTSTAPNQELMCGPNQNVNLVTPTIITADSKTENIQRIFAQGLISADEDNSTRIPIEVLYRSDGTVMAQTVGGTSEDFNWIKRDMNKSLSLDTPNKLSPLPSNSHETSRIDPNDHHNYAFSNTSINSKCGTIFDGGLQTLASAAATRRNEGRIEGMEADIVARKRAAAAIAAVGEEARNKRHQDMSKAITPNNLASNKVSIPHQGPRKRYLSQLTDSLK